MMKYVKTNLNSHGGVGHQFINWSLGLILSDKCDSQLIHSPFFGMAERWEKVFNLGKEFPHIGEPLKEVDLPVIDLGSNPSFNVDTAKSNLDKWIKIINDGEDGTLFKIPYDSYPGIFTEEIINHEDRLKNAYWHNKTKFNFDSKYTNVAIHIRRGNIHKTRNANRWLELSDYAKLMNYIRDNNETGKSIKFHIFSQGVKTSFSEILNDDVTLYLDGCDITSFNMLVSADILVTGMSTFSILAAYITDSPVMYYNLMNYTRWSNLDRFINVSDLYKENSKKITL